MCDSLPGLASVYRGEETPLESIVMEERNVIASIVRAIKQVRVVGIESVGGPAWYVQSAHKGTETLKSAKCEQCAMATLVEHAARSHADSGQGCNVVTIHANLFITRLSLTRSL